MSEQYIQANGLKLAYEEFGDPGRPVILLIMGLATQMMAGLYPYRVLSLTSIMSIQRVTLSIWPRLWPAVIELKC